MTKPARVALLMLFASTAAQAQSSPNAEATAAPPVAPQSSSEKVRDNPTAQYVLIKTAIGQAIGVIDARARTVEAAGYNLLKYCWTAENVLGDWAERAGLTGEMVVRALETRSWQRDLARAGYPEVPVAEAIGRYEAAMLAAGFTGAVHARAVTALVSELDGMKRGLPGAAQIRAIPRCDRERRSLGLNYRTVPEEGRARFVPYVLHQICQAQQLDGDDPVRCDYWLNGKTDGPMSFAGETVYSVRWADGTTTRGQFDPEQSRATDNTVTLRLKLPKVK